VAHHCWVQHEPGAVESEYKRQPFIEERSGEAIAEVGAPFGIAAWRPFGVSWVQGTALSHV
jgi:hypothetical protein